MYYVYIYNIPWGLKLELIKQQTWAGTFLHCLPAARFFSLQVLYVTTKTREKEMMVSILMDIRTISSMGES